MVDTAISVAAKIAEYFVAPIGRPFRYLWNYKTNLENLKKEEVKLKAKRDTVGCLIKVGEEPLPDVKLWQERVNRIIVEVSEVVVDNPEQANIQCCKGFSCPNLIYRYQLSKKAGGKLKSDVVDLVQEAATFKQISYRKIAEEPWLRSSIGYEAFESRSSVLKNIIDSLRDPDVNMVGIYGMGGIGKTTLAWKVAQHIQQDNPSHVIVYVEVSTTPNIKNIQQAIGRQLGLKFHDETEDGQASALNDHFKKEVTVSKGADNSGEKKDETEDGQTRALYDPLKKKVTVSEGADNNGEKQKEKKKEKKILLILDNIWGKIDLGKVGIPLGGDCKGLKLLLTTRSPHVLTNQMNSRCNFLVKTLEDAEAWSLFKSKAGMCVDYPDLKNIASEVAKECGNMPLAIVTIASALKDKEESTWSTALNELKNPSLEGFEETMTREVYTCIKFSYDHLDTKELKEIFLLCSRMGRTYDASIRDLFMYGLGLGFFKRSNTLEEAQCKVEDLVKKLKGNSLLLDAPNETRESLRHVIPDGERFAMHDVICDVARSIDWQKGNVCNVIDNAISCRWAKTNILKNCTSITLHNISEIPKDLRLELPQLEFFYMKTKDSFSKIVDDFFVEMPSLLVLHLIEMNLSPLPTSLSNLMNLQTLCLDACKLGDIADIGKLEKLEILSLRGSKIKKLSEEMRHLTSIRLLDLTDCSTLEIIPPNVISCFTLLEALYMYNTLIEWEVGGLNIGRKNAGLEELKHFCDRLTTLEIHIPNVKMSKGLLSPRLKRYKISIDDSGWISPPKNSRALRVELNTNDNTDEVFSQLKGIKQPELVADRSDDLTYSRNGNKWIWPPKNSRALRVHLNTNDNADEVILQLKGIKQLELCADLEDDFTKQSVSAGALPSLESLSLEHLNFEKICNVPLAAGSFCQLRTITVFNCDKLTNIFSFSTDRVLPKLQEIEVSRCENMEEIFAIEREDDVNNSELIHEIQFSQLCSVTLRYLPQLKSFCHRVKTTSQLQLTSSTNDGEIISEDTIDIPKSLFNEKVVFPNLETLEISGINAKKIWLNQLPTMSSSFQNLNRLNVIGYHNLKELFPSSMVTSFVQLQYLEIYSCSLLEEVVFMEELKDKERKDIQFPFLKEMKIKDCPNFKRFISNDKIGFPSLKAMEIMVCPNFKEFIFNDKVAIPNIKKLTISYIGNLEKIWHDQLVKDSFCKLKSLEVCDCKRLLNVFPSNIYGRLLSLESLVVSGCHSLEEIFDLRESSIYDSQMQIMLSFESLQRLKVSSCGSLKNLFSASILGKEGEVMEEGPARFLFPKLTSFVLDDLPELRSFYHGRHKVEWPVLKTLRLVHYGILSLVEQAFPCLEELSLKGKQVTMLCQGQFPESHFDRLKILRVCNDHESIFPFGSIQRYQNLEELTLSSSHYKEIFPHGEDQTQTKIKTLNLSGLHNLKYIWKQNSKLDLIFQNLEVLKVSCCHSLINLMQPPTSFQNLTSLGVDSSNSLINMGTSSVAKSLVQLTEMSISNCKKITEVIGNHGDVIEDEIIFRKLKSLTLKDLPSLTSFCSWYCTLNFRSLETLTVQRCPNMKIFSQGDLTTEKLQIVTIGWKSVELHSDFNLNTAIIQEPYEKAYAYPEVISLIDNGASSSHCPVVLAGPAVVQE